MSAKSLSIILVTVLLTVILMNNNDEMSFWLFGEAKIPKLAVLAGMFLFGWVIGFIMGRPKSKTTPVEDHPDEYVEDEDGLSEEDRDYIR